MREANCSVASIAEELKRPIESVYGMCKRLVRSGCLASKRGRPWTRHHLAALANTSLRDEVLAQLLHRTKAAVKKKRLCLLLRPRLREPWNSTGDSRLIELRKNGLSFSEIARALQRTEFAVSNRVHYLIKQGALLPLPRFERSRRGGKSFGMSREDRWTDAEREAVLSLWKAGSSAVEISAISKRSRYSIQNFLGSGVRKGLIGRLSSADVRTRLVRARQRRHAERCCKADELVRAFPNTTTAGYVVGVLYGDGFISLKRSGSIGLKSTNESFCRAFAEALQETFKRKTRFLSRIEPFKRIGGYEYRNVRYYEAFLHSTHLALALREYFGHTDEHRWCANPDKIMKIGERFADGVIQGFFDAEGSFMRNKEGRYYTSACSMNEKGLRSIHELMKRRGYNSRIGVDHRKQWKVALSAQVDVLKFAKEIGSRIDYKGERMQMSIKEKEPNR
jgi:intein-encoded DNA endonuclease-like protein